MSKIEVIPTIIAPNIREVETKIKMVEPYVKWVQLDIMDGIFVDNSTWQEPDELSSIDTQLKMEAHLMIDQPENRLAEWIASGVSRVIVHYESSNKIDEIIENIARAGLKSGLAINPDTSVDVLDKYIDSLDLVLIMTVYPGRGGQKFIEDTLPKIKKVKEKYGHLDIEVDGGINLETAPKVIEAGANLLASGSAVYRSKDIAQTIKTFQSYQ